MASGAILSSSATDLLRQLSTQLRKNGRTFVSFGRRGYFTHNRSGNTHTVFRKQKIYRKLDVTNPQNQVCCEGCHSRQYFTSHEPDQSTDPHQLVKSELGSLFKDIKTSLSEAPVELKTVAQYHFDGLGKAFRPMLVMLMAKACNVTNPNIQGGLLPSQKSIAMIAEMIHTASLIHDDVIDASSTRRGKPSTQQTWGHRKAILAGDYVLSVSSIILARIRNEEVVEVLAQVLEHLVSGEFMQLGSKEDENERFNHYIQKTFKKTASLIANSCKAVAILSEGSYDVIEAAYQYGRNIGIAFQLVDDLLDLTSSDSELGKPTTADLKLGLATAPVLFASHEFPELHALIMRRFSQPGDVDRARELVNKSEGVAHTRYLAQRHATEAVRDLASLHPSAERDALTKLTHLVLNRSK